MDHFAGLDVSVKETSICIVDDTGRIVREVKVASEPEALLKVLGSQAYRFKRIGLEAGPLSQWLFSALAEAELPVGAFSRAKASCGGLVTGASAMTGDFCGTMVGALVSKTIRSGHLRSDFILIFGLSASGLVTL